MEFSFEAYGKLAKAIIENGYDCCSYHDYLNSKKPCILRHDVDFDLERAAEFAVFEKKIGEALRVGLNSTYFVLLNTDFYNVFSETSRKLLCTIMESGQNIGLHFDEMQYGDDSDLLKIPYHLEKELDILSDIVGQKIDVVSMHRPSRRFLDADMHFPGVINSYSKTFFKEFKYVSDSRMNWREDVFSIIESGEYGSINILTHPIWYGEKQESHRKIIDTFLNRVRCRYDDMLNDNIRDYKEFMEK